MDPFEIGKQLGQLLEKVEAASVKIDTVGTRVESIETTLSKTVQPQLVELMAFKGNVAKIVVGAGGIAMAAFGLVWQGIAHYGSDILNLVLGVVQGRRVS